MGGLGGGGGLAGIPALNTGALQAGTGSGTVAVSGVLNVNTTAAGNVTTGETDLISYSLPANTLNANGKGIRIKAFGTLAANANTKTLKTYFGATQVTTSFGGGLSAGGWEVTADVFRTGAATQKSVGYVRYETSQQIRGPTVGAPTETLSGAITIKVTGQSGTASDDILVAGLIVESLG